MTSRPFHHGNLRAVLLEQAEAVVREEGVDNLSLRELARRAGVSHGAPRSHFADRRALLDALAERGFDRFAERIRSALARPGAFEERLRRVGHAYLDFAVDEAALMDLMFAAKTQDAAPAVRDAAARLFDVLDEALGDPGGADERTRFALLFAAAVQGAAALVVAGRVPRRQGEVLVDDATDVLLGSELAGRALPRR